VTNADLLKRREAAVPRGVATATPVFAGKAANAELWDVEGRRFIDFVGGIAVLNVGHRHPKIVAAVADQLDLYSHTAFQVVAYEPYVALAERLNALAPMAGAAKTIFFSTGAEATENAVKIARAATRRSGVIAFRGGFHGRTLFASALTGKVAPYKQQFGVMPPGVFHAPFPDAEAGISSEASLAALDDLFAADIAPHDVAAIIIEPVQGEGGFRIAPVDFVRQLRAICDRHGILLIADEVQTGFARTARMFAIEHYGVEPDLMAVAKSMGGGFPLSGVIGRAAIMDSVEPGGLGGTYAGSPIACAAGHAVLDVIAEERLLDRAEAIGAIAQRRLEQLAARNDTPSITGIRRLGAMIAFDLPDAATTKALCGAALSRGLILLSCGVEGRTIRILVPLTVSDAVLDEGLAILGDALAETRG